MTEKHDKFRELAEGRTNKALEAIAAPKGAKENKFKL